MPNATTWLIARDIGQRAEHDVRTLGHVTSSFIAERMRRLSTLL
jgi:sorbitol-specific phosphotransferase system component IIA